SSGSSPYDGGYVPLADCPHFGNRVAPHGCSGGEARHLSGDSDLDLDAAFIVNLLKFFESSAENIIDIRVSIIQLDLSEISAGAQTFRHCIGHEFAWINRPAVVVIETDLFRRGLVDDGPLPQVTGGTKFPHCQ